ncbi:MAG: 4-hydroxy-3-methylbut-2-enyl diphosphate reductase [Armatimonadetes bacterium]|nr:4-hydroxy-3-methylbut-2-enyl diphosphate reductase [Armatimonadota bacterium]
MKVEKAPRTGFCFGVRRAIDIMERVARERGGVETLGELVHNQQVLARLADVGMRVAKNVDDIHGNTVILSAHGVSPQVQAELQARNIEIVDTTCPFVERAQAAARRLAESGFFVVVYGEADHSEVKGILGCADGNGIATLRAEAVAELDPLPRRLGVLSQTTQIPGSFTQFVQRLVATTFTKNSELYVIDTICHDIRDRQLAALELAGRVELMLVIGGRNSANTNRLAELCSSLTQTHHIETADEIDPSWIRGKELVGITAGASTAEETVSEVLARLEALAGS